MNSIVFLGVALLAIFIVLFIAKKVIKLIFFFIALGAIALYIIF